MLRRWSFLLASLTLWNAALAGGGGPPIQVTPHFVLQGLSGVTVTEAPTGNFEVDSARWMSGVGYTYAVQIRVGTERVRVLLTPGASENSSTVNRLLAFVETATPTAIQRQALVRIARGFLQACAPQQMVQTQVIWPELTRRAWNADLGWQERVFGSVQVGWSGQEGLNVVAGNFVGNSAGINVNWARSSGHCVF